MMLKEIYIAVRDRLKTITSLKEVTWYTQQDVYSNKNEMYAIPVCYIEFDTIVFNSLPNKMQMAQRQFQFKVRTVSESYEDTEDAVLGHLELVQEVYLALQGYAHAVGDKQILNSVRRVSLKTDHQLSNLLVTEQTFECIAFDESAMPTYEKKKLTYSASVTIKNS